MLERPKKCPNGSEPPVAGTELYLLPATSQKPNKSAVSGIRITIVQSHLGYAIDANSLNLVANISHLEIV